ncbi:MAG: 3-oxoacyl-ACP reductase FabG [Deltaproteobacteria bacterium]|nr:3-oxoacyl-ACP reductase FabG [Deltaproteobacteria bacterium]
MKLKGKTAVVTGASRGVGRAVAIAYAREGARVVVNYSSNQAAAEATVKEIEALGSQAILHMADVSDRAEANSLISAAKERFGSVDILVNNAGITRPNLLIKMSEEEWDRVLDVHLKGAFFCTQAAALFMKEQNSGKIINVTSVAGIVGTVGQVNYSAAKGGIIAFTKSVARELARFNVCANTISLGIVATDMTEKIRTDEKLRDIYMNRILLRRFAEPDDITPAFVFLASDDANYITGQLVCVDGGYGMI